MAWSWEKVGQPKGEEKLKDFFTTLAAFALAFSPFILLFAIAFGVAVAKVWVVGSFATSMVKTASDDCGETYGIPFFSQDWFCPEVE